MIDIEKWQEIYLTVKQHKLRTALTAFGVFWGIFMLVTLLGAGNALERGALDQFGGRTNAVYIWSGSTTQLPYKGFPTGRRVTFSDHDIETIRQRVPDLDVVMGTNEVGGWNRAQYVVRGSESGGFITRGTFPEMARISSYGLSAGRFINPLDIEQRRKVAVLGPRVHQVLFAPDENPIGQHIKIADIYFQVIGVFYPEIAGEGSRRDEELIFIPNTTLRAAFNQSPRSWSLTITPKPGVHAAVVEEQVKKVIQDINFLHPDDQGVIRSFNMQEEMNKVQGLFTGIRLFSWVVAIGTILAGVIGVGNIMLIVVKERTREIGLRKALGATPQSIVAMIVQESVVITAVSGYLGLVVGVFLLEGIGSALQAASASDGNTMFARPEIDLQTALTALVILVIAGILASLLPASKAAKVNPIIALQDE